MLRILGRISSINVQKVVWCARELELPFERTDIGGAFGGTDTPAYRAMNPNGLVPVIDDDGFVMWESNAIVRYLAAGHGEESLWPISLKTRADADRWMDWQATELGPTMRDAFIQLVRTVPEKRDPARIAASANASERLISILDAHLAKRQYVTGHAFTMGDIPVGLQIHRWLGMPVSRAPRPNIEAWYARLRARPGAQEVLTLQVT
ncbi:MAG TPA: glutathione S-transferase [Candidatus Cybelea sp.]|nr:glutathione S-transferase [Candidatus Cybelea sp.]